MARVPPKNRLQHIRAREGRGLDIVSVCYVLTPGAEARLSRAIDILIAASPKNTALTKEGGIAPGDSSQETALNIVEDKEQ